MLRGPTITSGQERDVDWRQGLEDVFLCRQSINSAVMSPDPPCTDTAAQPTGAGPWVADNLMGSYDCPDSTPQELHPGLKSTSMDSSFDQLSMGPFAGKAMGDCGQLHPMSERQGENRVGFGDILPPRTSVSGLDSEHQVKAKRKVGRPIMHKGDPDDPTLTEKERRRIKRRIANRESARRVRYRRQEEMEELQLKMEEILEKNYELRQRAEPTLQQRNALAKEVQALQCQLSCVSAENQKMEAEVQALRQSLQVKMGALENELDKREAAAGEAGALSSAFGTTTVTPISAAQASPTACTCGPSTMPLDFQASGAMALFPSLDLDGINYETLPSINLDCLLDGPYHNCAN